DNGGNPLVVSGAGATTIGGVISGNGSLTMNGSGGMLTLGATNHYTGGTTVSAGTGRTTTDNALVNNGAPAVGPATVNLGGNEALSSLSMTAPAGTLRVAAGETLTVAQSSGSTSAAGTISLIAGVGASPGGALVKAGSSALEIEKATALGQNSSIS